jgi:hypothetical protein
MVCPAPYVAQANARVITDHEKQPQYDGDPAHLSEIIRLWGARLGQA